MCLNAYGNSEDYFFPMDSFEVLAKEVFPKLEKLVLYGFGEPLMHPNFIEMLEIARKKLPSDSTITFTTNGSLLTKNKIDLIVDNHLADEIILSCDMLLTDEVEPDLHTLESGNVKATLKYLIEKNSEKKIRVGIQTVLMKSNVKDIEKMIREFGSMGVDFIAVSHLYPFFENLRDEVLYTMISKEALEILEENRSNWKEIVLGVSKEKFAEKMQESYKEIYKKKEHIIPKNRPFSEIYNQAQSKAKEKNVSLNISLYLSDKERISDLDELVKLFDKYKRIAKESGLDIVLPTIFPKFSDRKCPYNDENASVIRSDGNVIPCFKFLWDHKSYLNDHERTNSSFSFGSIYQNSFLKIWESERYKKFRNKLRNMNKNIPYCGDCTLSSNNCFYAIEDTSDCWGNEPFCSECPYSLNLTTCVM
jgi:radical SAM protein with 4Fe4S-binding SPASM domain